MMSLPTCVAMPTASLQPQRYDSYIVLVSPQGEVVREDLPMGEEVLRGKSIGTAEFRSFWKQKLAENEDLVDVWLDSGVGCRKSPPCRKMRDKDVFR